MLVPEGGCDVGRKELTGEMEDVGCGSSQGRSCMRWYHISVGVGGGRYFSRRRSREANSTGMPLCMYRRSVRVAVARHGFKPLAEPSAIRQLDDNRLVVGSLRVALDPQAQHPRAQLLVDQNEVAMQLRV